MRIVFALTVLGTMLFLASQGERYNFKNKLSYEEGRRIFEAAYSKRADLIRASRNNSVNDTLSNKPKARRLDNAQGAKSIKELMDGFRGFL